MVLQHHDWIVPAKAQGRKLKRGITIKEEVAMKPTQIMQGKSGLVVSYGQIDIKATARIIAPRIREMLLQELEEEQIKNETQLKKTGKAI